MPLSASQIVTRACQIAKRPGFTVQAGQTLNQILLDLTREYDLPVALQTTNLTISAGAPGGGTGPYVLPANYLRAAKRDLIYLVSGVPYVLTQITLAQFDSLINITGIANFPRAYTTDVSTSPPSLFVYPPPVLAFNLQIRYFGTMPEIPNADTSAQTPWFPHQGYIINRLAGELMRDAGDPRSDAFLGDGPSGALGILRRFLNLQGDKEDAATVVDLDRRYYQPSGVVFPPSKISGGV
ncbi:MAG: hypothetical protein C5B60_01500 [Chloroflexi bacterium]|nr:MAG: hypothetical protein C5B60_01500 [Chloroflexota bacterium]